MKAVSLEVANLVKEALELEEPYYEALCSLAAGKTEIGIEFLQLLETKGLAEYRTDGDHLTPKGRHLQRLIQGIREVEANVDIEAIQEKWEELRRRLDQLNKLIPYIEDDLRTLTLEDLLTDADNFQTALEGFVAAEPTLEPQT